MTLTAAAGMVIARGVDRRPADRSATRTRSPRGAKGFGKTITGIYITHGHSDHWLGLARLLEHIPEARGYAAPEVARRADEIQLVDVRPKHCETE